MKVFRLVIALLFVNLASFLKAQTAGDLAGFTWKDKTVAIEALTAAQKSLFAEQPYVAVMALPESRSFEASLYQNVQTRLKSGNADFPTAIVDGYNQTKADFPEGDDQQIQVFEKLVELLRQ